MRLTQENLAQLNTMHDKYLKLNDLLTYEEVVLDKKLCYKLEKERNELTPIMTKYDEYLECHKSKSEFEELANHDNDPLIEKEIESIIIKIENLSNELISLLNTCGGVMQEIIVEVVNIDSDRLYDDIVKGYLTFANNNNFDSSVSKEKNTTYIKISGINVNKTYSKEAGLHAGDNETCHVYVYENYKEEDISFNDEDIVVTIARSSGAGGQHINTTDSAIKITHLKSGITATCQSERSQIQNREKALLNLKEKVFNYYSKLKAEFIQKAKKEQVKLIKNNFTIKYYNYETETIIDHNKRSIKLKDFLQGKEI